MEQGRSIVLLPETAVDGQFAGIHGQCVAGVHHLNALVGWSQNELFYAGTLEQDGGTSV